jgi:hypothetical protein
MLINEDEILTVKGHTAELLAMAILMAEGVCFMNNAKLEDPKNDNWNTVIYVLCNDIFAWGCADAESISNSDGDDDSEVLDLYRMHREDSMWGSAKWCCKKRKSKPQRAVIDAMKKAGVWDEVMESLPDNIFGQ